MDKIHLVVGNHTACGRDLAGLKAVAVMGGGMRRATCKVCKAAVRKLVRRQ